MPQPIPDAAGRPMFTCRRCGIALTADDLFELGMRLPDDGESRDDYCDAELIDYVEHPACVAAARAG
jgi:hypothetical protein